MIFFNFHFILILTSSFEFSHEKYLHNEEFPKDIKENHAIFCSDEPLNINCGNRSENNLQFVYIKQAKYGRMETNRCIRYNLGYIGCYRNVTKEISKICSARFNCSIENIEGLFVQQKKSNLFISQIPDPKFSIDCLKDLKSYLEVYYVCVKVKKVNCNTKISLNPFEKEIMSSKQLEIQKTENCKLDLFIKNVYPKLLYRIKVDLITFSKNKHNICMEYFKISEFDNDYPLYVCHKKNIENKSFTSSSSQISIIFNQDLFQNSFSKNAVYILKYEAILCTIPKNVKSFNKLKDGNIYVSTSLNSENIYQYYSIYLIIGISIFMSISILVVGIFCYKRQTITEDKNSRLKNYNSGVHNFSTYSLQAKNQLKREFNSISTKSFNKLNQINLICNDTIEKSKNNHNCTILHSRKNQKLPNLKNCSNSSKIIVHNDKCDHLYDHVDLH